MKRQSVSSSNVSSIGYDEKSETLEVEFNNGSVYQYDGVSRDIANGLLYSRSVGRFFYSRVKDQFPHKRL